MLRSARRLVQVPLVSAESIFTLVVVAGFFLLLARNEIPPLVIFLLELFLSA